MTKRFDLGFTGNRNGMTYPQQLRLRSAFSQLTEFSPDTTWVLHHGLCVGSDAQAHMLAECDGWLTVGHPPSDESRMADLVTTWRKPAKPYLVRNAEIVEEVVALFAAPDRLDQHRSGTWSTILLAVRSEIPVVLFWPDGSMTKWLTGNRPRPLIGL